MDHMLKEMTERTMAHVMHKPSQFDSQDFFRRYLQLMFIDGLV